MVRALLFDLGNVLVGLDFDRAYRAAAEISPFSADEIRERLAGLDLATPYECGLIDSAEFFERCRDGLQLDIDYEGFRSLWGDMFQDTPLLDQGWLEGLASDFRLVILSNTNELHMDWIRARYSVLQPFHALTLSYEVGVMKPGTEIYQAAVEASGCAPGQCFFVDDKPENVDGARALGIRAEVFEDAESLRSQIAALC